MPHSLDGLVLAASLAEVIGALFVAAVAAGCLRQYARPHLTAWALSWLAGAAAIAVGVGLALLRPLPVAVAAAAGTAGLVLRYLQLAAFLAGCRALFGRPRVGDAGLPLPVVAVALGVVSGALSAWRGQWRLGLWMLPVALQGLAFTWGGLASWRGASAAAGEGVRLVGGSLMLYGLARLHEVALAVTARLGGPVPHYALLLGFVDFLVLAALGVGLVLALLEDEAEKLRASEEKFERVFRTSPDGLAVSASFTDGGHFIDVNDSLARILGYTPEEMIGKTTDGLGVWLQPKDLDTVLRLLRENGRVEALEVAARTRNGDERLCMLWCEIVEVGQHRYVITLTRDVTDERGREQRLQESEERWRRLSEATFEGIALSRDGRIVDVNQRLAEMLGYAPAELIGKPVLDCVAPSDRARVQEAIRSGHVDTYQHLCRRKDGSTFPVETRARVLDEGDANVRVTAVRDISEWHRMEAELRRRETLAAMGSLVARVAHEVRTPLFSLSATVDALEAGGGTPDEQQELRDLLRSQVWRLSTLMRDLLDYGRPPELKLARAGLGEVVQRAARACQGLASQSGVRLALDLPDDLPELQADAGRLEQVFQNLVANAVQHSPRGATVRVAVRAVSAPRRGLACTVEDEGPGLQPADMQRLFEPFFTRRSGGTGMGLPIAQRFVEAHGGLLSAANRAEGGAVFTVFLPETVEEKAGALA